MQGNDGEAVETDVGNGVPEGNGAEPGASDAQPNPATAESQPAEELAGNNVEANMAIATQKPWV